jgi:XRN 5'-3' exonuclease N-terminus
MGVQGLLLWFESQFPRAFESIQMKQLNKQPQQRRNVVSRRFDHVYLDLNGLLYGAALRANNDRDVILKVFRTLDLFTKQMPPTRSLFIALDGVAPAAKLSTQRKRRFDRARKKSNQNGQQNGQQNSQQNGASSPSTTTRSKKKKKGKFNALKFTPGTDFTARLKEALEYWVVQRMQTNGRFARVEIVISSQNVAGEGEVKIVERICREVEAKRALNESHCIVSTDADVVLMALMLPVANVSLVISDVRHPTCTLLSMPALHRHYLAPLAKRVQVNAARVALDLGFLGLFLGNDYLPKMFGTSLDVLWPRYKAALARAGGAAGLIVQRGVGGGGGAQMSITWQRLFDVMPARAGRGDARVDVGSFVDGLWWVLECYTRGTVPDWLYQYAGHRAPSVRELRAYVAEPSHCANRPPATPLAVAPPSLDVFLLWLLPAEARDLVPRSLAALLCDADSPIVNICARAQLSTDDMLAIERAVVEHARVGYTPSDRRQLAAAPLSLFRRQRRPVTGAQLRMPASPTNNDSHRLTKPIFVSHHPFHYQQQQQQQQQVVDDDNDEDIVFQVASSSSSNTPTAPIVASGRGKSSRSRNRNRNRNRGRGRGRGRGNNERTIDSGGPTTLLFFDPNKKATLPL